MSGKGRHLAAVVALTAGALVAIALPAAAADEPGLNILDVTRSGNRLTVLVQADVLPAGSDLNPASVELRLNDITVKARSGLYDKGEPAASARIAVLAIDNSQSMAGTKFDTAKLAAVGFVKELPKDVSVGLVTFSSTFARATSPTLNHLDVIARINSLSLDPVKGTALYEGTVEAIRAAGPTGARTVLLLTDGQDFGNGTETRDTASAFARESQVKLDAVFLATATGVQPPADLELLVAGSGQVVSQDVGGLAKAFQDVASSITRELTINATLPPGSDVSGNLRVDVKTNQGLQLSTSAFRTFVDTGRVAPRDVGAKPVPVSAPLFTTRAIPIVLGLVFAGLLLALYVLLSAFRRDNQAGRVRRRLSTYTLSGRAAANPQQVSTALGSSQIARTAVELAGRIVQRRDFETSLGQRLEAGGVPLRPAEWTLIHAGIAVLSAVLLLLVSGGTVAATAIGLILGLVLPWAYLIAKETRRTSVFLGQLPDTLQLLAGSLSAGYSIPQAMDTVVREGQQPITGEFNRALVEARLGVPIEDAMEGIADRMKSKDFAWVVMAIRIQREVGGNLAELLTTVSGTLRERDRLRRQVKVLSAEGRLSAWILGLLPLVFTTYLVLVQPSYLSPLVHDPLGWALLLAGTVLLGVGTLWMTKAVSVEV